MAALPDKMAALTDRKCALDKGTQKKLAGGAPDARGGQPVEHKDTKERWRGEGGDDERLLLT